MTQPKGCVTSETGAGSDVTTESLLWAASRRTAVRRTSGEHITRTNTDTCPQIGVGPGVNWFSESQIRKDCSETVFNSSLQHCWWAISPPGCCGRGVQTSAGIRRTDVPILTWPPELYRNIIITLIITNIIILYNIIERIPTEKRNSSIFRLITVCLILCTTKYRLLSLARDCARRRRREREWTLERRVVPDYRKLSLGSNILVKEGWEFLTMGEIFCNNAKIVYSETWFETTSNWQIPFRGR